jgi:dsRNA-specific ribonuclease
MEEVIVPFNINNVLITKDNIKTLFSKYNLDINVNDLSYYHTALTHKSYIVSEYTNYNYSVLKQIKESMDDSIVNLMPESSERIEFFGDTVIKCVVAKYLFLRYPGESEGFLTKTKTKIENRKSLANFARKLGLDNYLIMSKQNEDAGNRDSDKFLEDAFEAFIGALLFDQGFEYCDKYLTILLETDCAVISAVEKILTPLFARRPGDCIAIDPVGFINLRSQYPLPPGNVDPQEKCEL